MFLPFKGGLSALDSERQHSSSILTSPTTDISSGEGQLIFLWCLKELLLLSIRLHGIHCYLFLAYYASVLSNPVVDVQLSPKKALRAAILKCRFADTILKAQQKTLLNHVRLVLIFYFGNAGFFFSFSWYRVVLNLVWYLNYLSLCAGRQIWSCQIAAGKGEVGKNATWRWM